ncbi:MULTISPECIES: hypothetical protein [Cupriavidus]|uniref:hypothetical protein n=1 Tax=Cupriavidus sp. DF5525 TaxID=3160989 RepID=UPI0003B05D17|nr:hypothetical protein N234_01245 [Ralstonia pickettii DTP0602]
MIAPALLRIVFAGVTLLPLALAAWALPWPLRARIAALALLALCAAAVLALDPLAAAFARVDGILSAPGCGG